MIRWWWGPIKTIEGASGSLAQVPDTVAFVSGSPAVLVFRPAGSPNGLWHLDTPTAPAGSWLDGASSLAAQAQIMAACEASHRFG